MKAGVKRFLNAQKRRETPTMRIPVNREVFVSAQP